MLIAIFFNTICHNFIGKFDPIQIIQLFTVYRLFKTRGNSLFCHIFSGIIKIRCQATEYTLVCHVEDILLQGSCDEKQSNIFLRHFQW